MTRWTALIALGATLLLAACTPPGTYPVSGETCAPGDPVQTIDPALCTTV